MSQHNNAADSARFTIHRDGAYFGDDMSGGELAGVTLYVVRALAQIDSLLGLGEIGGLRAFGGERELDARVDHESDSGLAITGSLVSRESQVQRRPDREVAASLGDELGYVLDSLTEVELVAGALLVASDGRMVAEKVPGVPHDALAGTGRRMKVAHDSFVRLLGATSLTVAFEWGCLVAAPIGDGVAVAIADSMSDCDHIIQAAHLAGSMLVGVRLEELGRHAGPEGESAAAIRGPWIEGSEQ